ncbi:MAG TPA: DUF5681 domain-containing protein [Acidimicrobiales bacterium]
MPWEKGQSGNPLGRRQAKPVTDAILAELKKPHQHGTRLEAVAARLVNLILRGERAESVAALKLLLGYTDGLPHQPIDVEGAVEHTVTIRTIREALGLHEVSA